MKFGLGRKEKGEGMKILCIDDEIEMRQFIAEFLGRFGHDVIGAASGKDGLKLFGETPDINVVITDRRMPGGMLGEEVVRKIKKLSPKTRVIFMSGGDSKEVRRVAKAAGADRILLKPFRLEELEQTLSS